MIKKNFAVLDNKMNDNKTVKISGQEMVNEGGFIINNVNANGIATNVKSTNSQNVVGLISASKTMINNAEIFNAAKKSALKPPENKSTTTVVAAVTTKLPPATATVAAGNAVKSEIDRGAKSIKFTGKTVAKISAMSLGNKLVDSDGRRSEKVEKSVLVSEKESRKINLENQMKDRQLVMAGVENLNMINNNINNNNRVNLSEREDDDNSQREMKSFKKGGFMEVNDDFKKDINTTKMMKMVVEDQVNTTKMVTLVVEDKINNKTTTVSQLINKYPVLTGSDYNNSEKINEDNPKLKLQLSGLKFNNLKFKDSKSKFNDDEPRFAAESDKDSKPATTFNDARISASKSIENSFFGADRISEDKFYKMEAVAEKKFSSADKAVAKAKEIQQTNQLVYTAPATERREVTSQEKKIIEIKGPDDYHDGDSNNDDSKKKLLQHLILDPFNPDFVVIPRRMDEGRRPFYAREEFKETFVDSAVAVESALAMAAVGTGNGNKNGLGGLETSISNNAYNNDDVDDGVNFSEGHRRVISGFNYPDRVTETGIKNNAGSFNANTTTINNNNKDMPTTAAAVVKNLKNSNLNTSVTKDAEDEKGGNKIYNNKNNNNNNLFKIGNMEEGIDNNNINMTYKYGNTDDIDSINMTYKYNNEGVDEDGDKFSPDETATLLARLNSAKGLRKVAAAAIAAGSFDNKNFFSGSPARRVKKVIKESVTVITPATIVGGGFESPALLPDKATTAATNDNNGKYVVASSVKKKILLTESSSSHKQPPTTTTILTSQLNVKSSGDHQREGEVVVLSNSSSRTSATLPPPPPHQHHHLSMMMMMTTTNRKGQAPISAGKTSNKSTIPYSRKSQTPISFPYSDSISGDVAKLRKEDGNGNGSNNIPASFGSIRPTPAVSAKSNSGVVVISSKAADNQPDDDRSVGIAAVIGRRRTIISRDISNPPMASGFNDRIVTARSKEGEGRGIFSGDELDKAKDGEIKEEVEGEEKGGERKMKKYAAEEEEDDYYREYNSPSSDRRILKIVEQQQQQRSCTEFSRNPIFKERRREEAAASLKKSGNFAAGVAGGTTIGFKTDVVGNRSSIVARNGGSNVEGGGEDNNDDDDDGSNLLLEGEEGVRSINKKRRILIKQRHPAASHPPSDDLLEGGKLLLSATTLINSETRKGGGGGAGFNSVTGKSNNNNNSSNNSNNNNSSNSFTADVSGGSGSVPLILDLTGHGIGGWQRGGRMVVRGGTSASRLVALKTTKRNSFDLRQRISEIKRLKSTVVTAADNNYISSSSPGSSNSNNSAEEREETLDLVAKASSSLKDTDKNSIADVIGGRKFRRRSSSRPSRSAAAASGTVSRSPSAPPSPRVDSPTAKKLGGLDSGTTTRDSRRRIGSPKITISRRRGRNNSGSTSSPIVSIRRRRNDSGATTSPTVDSRRRRRENSEENGELAGGARESRPPPRQYRDTSGVGGGGRGGGANTDKDSDGSSGEGSVVDAARRSPDRGGGGRSPSSSSNKRLNYSSTSYRRADNSRDDRGDRESGKRYDRYGGAEDRQGYSDGGKYNKYGTTSNNNNNNSNDSYNNNNNDRFRRVGARGGYSRDFRGRSNFRRWSFVRGGGGGGGGGRGTGYRGDLGSGSRSFYPGGGGKFRQNDSFVPRGGGGARRMAPSDGGSGYGTGRNNYPSSTANRLHQVSNFKPTEFRNNFRGPRRDFVGGGGDRGTTTRGGGGGGGYNTDRNTYSRQIPANSDKVPYSADRRRNSSSSYSKKEDNKERH